MPRLLWIAAYWALLCADTSLAQSVPSSANQFPGPAPGSRLAPSSTTVEVTQSPGFTKPSDSGAANHRDDGIVDNSFGLPPSNSSAFGTTRPIVAGAELDTTANAFGPADPTPGIPLSDPTNMAGSLMMGQAGKPADLSVGWESPGPDFFPQGGWLTNSWNELQQRLRTWPLFSPSIWRNFSEFGGVQAFKGPADLGVNGDFGFYKGMNFAWPLLEAWGIGYQIGGEIVVSNLSGSGGPLASTREQYFATTGLFRRAASNQGLQGGAVIDYLHDNFYVHMDMLQVRPELSYVIGGGHEFGLWAAVNLTNETKSAPAFVGTPTVTWLATDQYNFFYRRSFSSGGVGRAWVGFTEQRDVTFGADATAPLSENWAIQASYNYLLPMGNDSLAGNTRETWGLSMCLVWYPHCKTPNSCFNPYKPLFNVGDNSSLFIRTK